MCVAQARAGDAAAADDAGAAGCSGVCGRTGKEERNGEGGTGRRRAAEGPDAGHDEERGVRGEGGSVSWQFDCVRVCQQQRGERAGARCHCVEGRPPSPGDERKAVVSRRGRHSGRPVTRAPGPGSTCRRSWSGARSRRGGGWRGRSCARCPSPTSTASTRTGPAPPSRTWWPRPWRTAPSRRRLPRVPPVSVSASPPASPPASPLSTHLALVPPHCVQGTGKARGSEHRDEPFHQGLEEDARCRSPCDGALTHR